MYMHEPEWYIQLICVHIDLNVYIYVHIHLYIYILIYRSVSIVYLNAFLSKVKTKMGRVCVTPRL